MILHSVLDGPENGTPLILGPSLGTTTRLWQETLPALTRTHRVLRFDLPGHGGSADVPALIITNCPARAVRATSAWRTVRTT